MHAVSTALALLASLTGHVALAEGRAYLFLGGAQSTEENFRPYMDAPEVGTSVVDYEASDPSPFTGNHVRDYAKMNERLGELASSAGDAGVVLFGYSIGGKFAARLALENPAHVRGVFLVDPVDGAPPLFGDAQRYPTFLTEGTGPLTVRTVIVESEFGGRGGFLGIPCVTQNFGPNHFAGFVASASLTRLTAQGAGHTAFLAPPLTVMARTGCARSEGNEEAIREQTVDWWRGFLRDLGN